MEDNILMDTNAEHILISTANITKVYGVGTAQVVAINNLSLEVKNGEFLCIMGPSGCGKTTLLNILGCLDRPTAGTVYFNGTETISLTSNQMAELRNKQIGFIFQQFNLIPRLNALENVMLPLILNLQQRANVQKVRELLNMVGLGGRINHKPTELSGGEQQRVAIARALINEPTLIIADEPTGNLDTKTGEEIMGLIIELNKKGKTLIIATHSQNLAMQAHRVIYLKDGQIEKEVSAQG